MELIYDRQVFIDRLHPVARILKQSLAILKH